MRERVRQNRAAQRLTAADAVTKPTSAERRLGAPHEPGDHVFDRVTGQEGIVIGGTADNVVVPTPR